MNRLQKVIIIPILFITTLRLLYMFAVQSCVVLSDLKNKDYLSKQFALSSLVTYIPWTFQPPVGGSSCNSLNRTNKRVTRKLPDAIIIGAKKAGTRALLEFIRIHPNVSAAGHEVHYFDRNYFQGEEWYRSMMPSTGHDQITMEKTPNYFVAPEVPRRMFEIKPSMKLILIVRDPVERAISEYAQLSTKHLRQRSFENVAFKDFKKLVVNGDKLLIHTGKYSEHLKNWLNFFALDQFCFINGERLVTNPAGELEKLQNFLGIKRVITHEHFFFNATKKFPCLNRQRKKDGTLHCLREKKGRPHPLVSLRARIALYHYFAPFNKEFYNMTGIDFGWEKRSPL